MSGQKTPDSHNYSETVGTRLTPQTKRQFDQYKQDNELGNAEACRRLIRAGLDAADSTTLRDRLTAAVWVALVAGYPALVAYAGRPLTAAVWVALVAGYSLFQPEVDRAIDRLPNPLKRLT